MLTRLHTVAKPENGATLPVVLLRCLRAPFLGVIVSRLLVISFRFAQPLLISRTIRFVTSSTSRDSNAEGYWLIAAALTIYIGKAVSLTLITALYPTYIPCTGCLVDLQTPPEPCPGHDQGRYHQPPSQSRSRRSRWRGFGRQGGHPDEQ